MKNILNDGMDNFKRIVNENRFCNDKTRGSVFLHLGEFLSGLSMEMFFDGRVDKENIINRVVFYFDDSIILAFDMTLDYFDLSNSDLFEIVATVTNRVNLEEDYEDGHLDINGNEYEN